MSTNLFNRVAIATDLHLGKSNNDRWHNQNCLDFITWFAEQAKENNCDTVMFLGDWHDNRNSIQVSTLDFSLRAMEVLSNIGVPVYFIPGNHDEFYREKRDVTSVDFARNLKNINIIEDITTVGNVTICPWLVAQEHKRIPALAKNSKYIFGHFEVPTFLLNAMIEMPDHGTVSVDTFKDVEQWVFSGHFHKRQAKGNICYIGNCFPHSFNDAWDDDRGMMILDWMGKPEFKSWPKAPKYRTYQLSDILEDPFYSLDDRTFAKVDLDITLSFDDIQNIKEVLIGQFNPRKLDITSSKEKTDDIDNSQIEFQSIDQIILESLDKIESTSVNKELLKNIFQGLV